MKTKWKPTIGKELVAMILFISVALSSVALVVAWKGYTTNTYTLFEQVLRNAANTFAANTSPEEIDYYYKNQVPDERYYEIQRLLHTMVDDGQVEYLLTIHVEEKGATYIFDSDCAADANGECALGYYTELGDLFLEHHEQFTAGAEIEPIIAYDEEAGWLMMVMRPVCYENGTLAGYVIAEVCMDETIQQSHQFLLVTVGLLAVLTGLLIAICLRFAKWRIVSPVRKLTTAIEDFQENGNPRAFKALRPNGGKEISSLTEAFKLMAVEMEINTIFEQEVEQRESQMQSDLDVTKEIGKTLLPRSLPPRREGYPFGVQGVLCPEESLSGVFYDYFLIDADRLCVLVGDVPGDGVPQVLYSAMARAIIKSQMRAGLPMAETMTEANRQIHELSETMCLRMLIGVLDSATGRFSCVNADGEQPYLLRFQQDRYQKLSTLSYAPLGQSANVTYQVQEIQLRQGDRLLLCTGALAQIAGQEGQPFAATQLGTALNGKELRLGTLEETLAGVQAAGSAFAARPGAIGTYALLALEYNRRDREKAHLVLTADLTGSLALRKFIREQMESNGLTNRQIAELSVLGDELFSLCCRQSGEGSRFMAEYELSDGGDVLRLRLKGAFGGRDPVAFASGEASRNGAAYIQRSCEQVLFEQSGGTDAITVVRRLDKAPG